MVLPCGVEPHVCAYKAHPQKPSRTSSILKSIALKPIPGLHASGPVHYRDRSEHASRTVTDFAPACFCLIGLGVSPIYTQSSLRALDSIIYHHRIIPTRDTQVCRCIHFLFEVRHDMLQQWHTMPVLLRTGRSSQPTCQSRILWITAVVRSWTWYLVGGGQMPTPTCSTGELLPHINFQVYFLPYHLGRKEFV